jgi:hypothetical protein
LVSPSPVSHFYTPRHDISIPFIYLTYQTIAKIEIKLSFGSQNLFLLIVIAIGARQKLDSAVEEIKGGWKNSL